MGDESKTAVAVRGAPTQPARKPIEAWMADKAIAGYAPGTPNHAALMAGVHASLGKVQALELSEVEFDQAAAAFLAVPIGYRVLGSGKGGVR